MSDRLTPETDEVEAAIIEFRRHSNDPVPWSIIKLARDLERKRDAYAETLREIDRSGMVGNAVRNRHPELAGNDQSLARRASGSE